MKRPDHLIIHLLTLIWLWSATSAAVCQDEVPDSVMIGSIQLEGNEKTRDFVVMRELEFSPNQWVTTMELAQARMRILNLNLFNNVDFLFEEDGDLLNLKIVVYERWYLFPVPIFFISDRDWDKRSYGMGVIHANFRGRAETLWSSAWFGYNPGFNLNYHNRWFGGDKRFYTRFNMAIQQVRSKSAGFVDEREKHRSAAIVFGRRFGLHLYADFQVGFNFLAASNDDLLWRPSGGEDHVMTTAFGLRYDTRDLWEYPKTGYSIETSLTSTQLLNGGLSYYLLSADLRRYVSHKSIILAVRVNTQLTRKRVPSYRRLYLGYGERIRGHFNRVVEGDNQFVAAVEARFPIFREKYIPLSQDAWYSSYLQFLKFGLYFTVFRDMGAIWQRGEALTKTPFLKGSGFGLNLILPYSIVLRFERAFDDFGRGETIFDAGLSL